MKIIGITTSLPLKFTVLSVAIPPNFTTDLQWHTTGNRDIFYGVDLKKLSSDFSSAYEL